MDGKFCINNVLTKFEELTHKPEVFLNYDESLSSGIKAQLKYSYDFLKSEKLLSKNALPELLTKDFELEQIWQQIELQNADFATKSIANISKVLLGKDQLVFSNILENTEGNTDFSSDSNTNKDEQNSSEAEYKSENENDMEDLDFENRDDNNGSEISSNDNFKNKASSFRNSIVDDEFFKLDEMESFLKAEENKLEKPNKNKHDSDSDSDEGSIDLFKSDSEEDESIKTAKFKDFFVSKTDNSLSKQDNFDDDMGSDDNEQTKSSFELRQERLQTKIMEIEETAISDKPWTLQGEISADSRPQNSLLEEVVEFDLTSKPAPVITENVTQQLEDIIRQRIKEKHFDSVERKEKPVETLLEYKKKIVLDQEKSKHSLAQIYEKEFLDQQASLNKENSEGNEEEPELHKEVKTMLKDLFSKLDALCNFHFTPKQAIPELKIVTNLPAIVMEEVAPVTISDSVLLAPEEIRNKPKGDVLGKSERTKTDKKRERRKKKLKQKLHVNKTINKNMIVDKKSKKIFNKGKNTSQMRETLDKKSFKSSSAFFSQLEEQVQSSINSKMSGKSTVDKTKKMSAKKLKL